MTRSTTTTVRTSSVAEVGDIAFLADMFFTSLEAQAKSPRTVKTYSEAVHQLIDYLTEQGMPRVVANISGEHLNAFIVSLLQRTKVSTANNRYRALQQFWKFLHAEGEIRANPFDSPNMKAPKIPDEPVEHVELDDLRKLLATCSVTKDAPRSLRFDNRRDDAIIRFFADTGVRSAELVGLTVDDIDVRARSAWVLGKGNRHREVTFAAKTALAMNRYLSERRQHKDAESPWFWLGPRGRLTDSGVRQMLERRSAVAGIGHVHPHMLRHTAATEHMREGGSETGLMRHMGWRSPQMIHRYTAAAADELAREEHRRMALGDRL